MGRTTTQPTKQATCRICGDRIYRSGAKGEKWVHTKSYPGHPGAAKTGTTKDALP